MRPRLFRAPRPTTAGPPAPRGRDRPQREQAADLAGVARCPCCRAPLVARMGCGGPYFHCACAENGSPHSD